MLELLTGWMLGRHARLPAPAARPSLHPAGAARYRWLEDRAYVTGRLAGRWAARARRLLARRPR